MLFHEIYGCYYRCVGDMINLALEHQLTEQKMLEIIHQNAFEESHLHIMPALQQQRWQVIDNDLQTPLQHHYQLPITTLEKQWLKAISLDPKFKLFSIHISDLDDIEPLFTPDDYFIYDQYADGDPYDDEHYQYIFQLLLQALHEKRKIKIHYLKKEIICLPYHIEYSLKDDKFRLLAITNNNQRTYNINKIKTIELLDIYQHPITIPIKKQKYFILEIYDERNALERVMTHFADMKKQAKKVNQNCYRIKIYYEKEDETELVIRVLTFGPMVKVIEPKPFVDLIKERLIMQKKCHLR